MTANIINKTMDRSDLEHPQCVAILQELFDLMKRMQDKGAQYSSWYGNTDPWPSLWDFINRGEDYQPWPGNPDELRIPWFLLWEICWLIANTPIQPNSRILDMGGAGSLFSCYLADRGHEVYTIDLQDNLCRQAEDTAGIMGWQLKAQTMDMSNLDFPDEYFDHVFSVCVFEHLPISGRIQCSEKVKKILKPGGTASYTFDYANPQMFSRFNSPADVQQQLIEPSKLALRGNGDFHDTGQRYLIAPQCFGYARFMKYTARFHAFLKGSIRRSCAINGKTSYTFGALFLEKKDL